ncbi:MAG: signal peptidase II [Candidatus Falkowbacteria bacterium]|nr:signal peptidase II [Candidatus Falkowbacteria bacterium]
MVLSKKKKMAAYYLAAIFFVALDRLLKVLAQKYFQGGEKNIIDGLVKFGFAPNYNIALSLPLPGFILFIIIPLLIFGILFYSFILLKRGEVNFAGLLTIISFCAISNFYDRLRFGFVIDYLNIKWFTVLNLADIMIVINIFLLGIYYKVKFNN